MGRAEKGAYAKVSGILWLYLEDAFFFSNYFPLLHQNYLDDMFSGNRIYEIARYFRSVQYPRGTVVREVRFKTEVNLLCVRISLLLFLVERSYERIGYGEVCLFGCLYLLW